MQGCHEEVPPAGAGRISPGTDQRLMASESWKVQGRLPGGGRIWVLKALPEGTQQRGKGVAAWMRMKVCPRGRA